MPWGVSPRIVTNTTTSHFDTGRGVLIFVVGKVWCRIRFAVDAEMVSEPGHKAAHPVSDLIPHLTKAGHGFRRTGGSGRRRIGEALVNQPGGAGKDRARLAGVIADGNNIVEWLPDKLLDRL